MPTPHGPCFFCHPGADPTLEEAGAVRVIDNRWPLVPAGHGWSKLIFTRAHAESLETSADLQALALVWGRTLLEDEGPRARWGICNVGLAAGGSQSHLHAHAHAAASWPGLEFERQAGFDACSVQPQDIELTSSLSGRVSLWVPSASSRIEELRVVADVRQHQLLTVDHFAEMIAVATQRLDLRLQRIGAESYNIVAHVSDPVVRPHLHVLPPEYGAPLHLASGAVECTGDTELSAARWGG
jgi:hypothetical protein